MHDGQVTIIKKSGQLSIISKTSIENNTIQYNARQYITIQQNIHLQHKELLNQTQ